MQVDHKQVEGGIVVDIDRADPHARLDRTAFVQGATPQQGPVDKSAIPPVQPQLVDGAVVGHEDIGAAIAVEVAAHHSQTIAEGRAEPGYCRYVGKGAVAVVAIQHVRHGSIVIPGTAVIAIAEMGEALSPRLQRPVDVVRHEQIEVAVRVVVDEGRTRSPARVPHPRGPGDIAEAPLAIVLQQCVRFHVRRVEVRVAVAVAVACSHPHPVAAVAGATPRRDVLEAAIPLVAVKLIGVVGRDFQASPCTR